MCRSLLWHEQSCQDDTMEPMVATDGSEKSLRIRPVRREEGDRLEAIRRASFAPIFASFRRILGHEIYELAQAREDEGQGELLRSMLAENSGWDVYVATVSDEVVGFVSIRNNDETKVGEIGLNAVDPQYAGSGIGTTMYRFAVSQMRKAGMKVATVATGGDSSHEPARRAYRKAGFSVEIPSVWMCQKL